MPLAIQNAPLAARRAPRDDQAVTIIVMFIASGSARWIKDDLRVSDTLHMANDRFAAGSFRCGTDEPDFRQSGPLTAYYFVFPRTPVGIVGHGAGAGAFTTTPSQFICYAPGASFSRTSIRGLPDHCDYLAVNAGWLDSGSAGELPDPGTRMRSLPCPSTLYLRQRLLIADMVRGVDSVPLAVEADVASFLQEVMAAARPERRRRRRTDPTEARLDEKRRKARIEKAKALIASHPPNTFCLSDIANEVNISPWYLSREFNRYAGVSLQRYVTMMRLHQSLELIVDRNLSISAVAQELGFSHHSHFSSAFLRAFGCTPSKFRKAGGFAPSRQDTDS